MKTILHNVWKFQVDHACFIGEEVDAKLNYKKK